MKATQLMSHQDLLEKTQGKKEAFVLLYKAGSESSECAINNIEKLQGIKDYSTKVFLVDVTKVRDIHPAYSVQSAPSMLVFKNGAYVNVVKGCMDQKYYEALIAGELEQKPANSQKEKKQKRVTVYTTPTCSWCTKIKEHLDRHSIKYREVNVAADQRMAEEMKRKSGQMGVPQTEIDGRMIVGFDRPKIDKLLEIA
jgi:glutaredoxin-like YruB-family protein